jgi:hypothetical protein
VRKELHDTADITPGKEVPITTEQKAGWALYPGRRKEKSLPLRGIEPLSLGHPAHGAVPILNMLPGSLLRGLN